MSIIVFMVASPRYPYSPGPPPTRSSEPVLSLVSLPPQVERYVASAEGFSGSVPPWKLFLGAEHISLLLPEVGYGLPPAIGHL